jgi:hypothetical protein
MKRYIFFFILFFIFCTCTNYKKVCAEKDDLVLVMRDSLAKVNRENVWLQDSIEKLYPLQVELVVKSYEIKRLQDSLLFYSNIEQIPFDKWIFNSDALFEKEHNYKILRQQGSVFYGAQNASDFYIYQYENFKIFNNDNELLFEISYLNKDGRGIWVRSLVDDRLSPDSFSYIFYDSLTKDFREFYEKNFLKK